MTLSVLAGPAPAAGTEGYAAHVARLGPLPPSTPALIDTVERSDLRGKGGAGFPAATNGVLSHRSERETRSCSPTAERVSRSVARTGH